MSSNLRVIIELESLGDTMAEVEVLLRETFDFEGYENYSIKIEEIKNENVQSGNDDSN